MITVFFFSLIPFLNFPEKLILSFKFLISDIDITSYAPKYYYTKLGDKKISTIEAASKNGLLRAETAVQGADGELGELQETSIGVFQILGKNSDDEYSWGGTLNTSHKEKTISVNVKQRYEIK